MKLFVDDLRDPAISRPGEDWHWAKTITEAVRLLAAQDIEAVAVVSLDHDIAHLIEAGGVLQPVACPENYTAVAHYIAAMEPSRRPKTVYVHTANPAGSGDIHNILRGKVDNLVRRRA